MHGEDLGMVTVTICRMAFTLLSPQKSSLGLCANPPTPHYPSGMLKWIWHLQHLKVFYMQWHNQCWLGFIVVGWLFFLGWGLLLSFCLSLGWFFFKIPYCLLKNHFFQLLIPHLITKLLSLVYDNFHSIQCNLKVLWLQVENNHHKSMLTSSPVIQQEREKRKTETVICETGVSA